MIAFFIDRDGVINEDIGLAEKPKKLKILPNVTEAIKKLNKLGLVIIVTNQPSIARNVFDENYLNELHEKMKIDLENAKIDAIYYCPHHPEKHHADIAPEAMKYRIDCECRKPRTGMIKEAAKHFNLDLKKCFVIGDRTVDIKMGIDAGCKTILVKTGASGKDVKYDVEPDFICKDLMDASGLIERNFKTKAIILVGGRGERMKQLTYKIPKPMLPIAGKPVLEYQIKLLKKHGITKIILCGHYLFDVIKNYFGLGKKFGVEIEYCDEKEPMGTGGAIKNAEMFLKDVENFIAFNGDVMTEIDVKKLLDFHEINNGIGTLVLRLTDHPIDSDIVEIDDNKKLVNFVGRDQKKILTANTGLFVFNKKILDFIPLKFCSIEKDIIKNLYSGLNFYGYVTDEYIKDMGTFERYENVKKRYE